MQVTPGHRAYGHVARKWGCLLAADCSRCNLFSVVRPLLLFGTVTKRQVVPSQGAVSTVPVKDSNRRRTR